MVVDRIVLPGRYYYGWPPVGDGLSQTKNGAGLQPGLVPTFRPAKDLSAKVLILN